MNEIIIKNKKKNRENIIFPHISRFSIRFLIVTKASRYNAHSCTSIEFSIRARIEITKWNHQRKRVEFIFIISFCFLSFSFSFEPLFAVLISIHFWIACIQRIRTFFANTKWAPVGVVIGFFFFGILKNGEY